MNDDSAFYSLETFLASVPGIVPPFGHGFEKESLWWIKFSIDIENHLAWHVVQELAHVLNYLSVSERLPTVFKPVSPPPYMNGGPGKFLSWVIECSDKTLKPDTVASWLEGRLTKPVGDVEKWAHDE